MKKRTVLLVFLMVFTLCMGLAVSAHAAGDEFIIDKDGVLTKYNGPGGDVVIPDGVTEIGGYSSHTRGMPAEYTIFIGAFENCENLTSVTIPDSVTKICDDAFANCTSLTSVTVPDSVTWASANSFRGCPWFNEKTGDFITVGKVLVQYQGAGGDVIIPDGVTTIAGYSYRKIGYESTVCGGGFVHCKDLTSVTIPDSVTNIGEYAFYGCTGLTSLTIPGSVISIGEYAFYDCTGLTSAIIFDGVAEIDRYAFKGCRGLTSVTILDSVTNIGEHAFSGCTGLTSAIIFDGVAEIGRSAFSGCTGLTSVTIPDSMTSISYGAFSGCTGLTSVTIPNSVTNIGEYAFSGCRNLSGVVIPDSVTNAYQSSFRGSPWFDEKSGDFIMIGKVLVQYQGDGGDIVIPDGTLGIGGSAFYDCDSLTSVTIPDSVVVISENAFRYCTNLTSVTVSGGVGNAGKSSFIGENAFSGCKSLTSVTFSDSVTGIGRSAFSDCTSLTSVTLPDSVTSIDYSTFSGCTSLTSVTLPNSVTRIDSEAFRDCTSLISLTAPDNPIEIASDAFYHSRYIEEKTGPIIIGKTLYVCSVIDGNAYIPDGVVRVSNICPNAKTVTIPSSVIHIDSDAFTYKTYIRTGEYGPKSDKLVSIKIDIVIHSTPGSYAEMWAAKHEFPFVADLAEPLQSSDFTVEGSLLVKYTGAGGDVIVPEGITAIDSRAFSSCTTLTGVTLPNGVTRIGEEAFSGCTSLTGMAIPDSVTSIGRDAFAETPWLKAKADDFVLAGKVLIAWQGSGKVSIPKCVSSIGDEAFFHREDLTDIAIPNGVVHIGENAFAGCTGLTNVTIPDSVVSLGRNAFAETPWLEEKNSDVILIGKVLSVYRGGDGDVHIPDGVIGIGEHAFSDCTALTSITIPESVVCIGQWAFSGCGGLTSVTLPNGLPCIEDCAFFGCSGLTDVIIPDSVTSIGNWVFCGCTGLSSVTIPDSVTRIGNGAFSNCAGLTNVTVPNSVIHIGEQSFSGVTVHGVSGSCAEAWAVEHGLAFEADQTWTPPRAAYTSTQSVEVDGRPVSFQMYALKDGNGYDTNYVKARDVALTLNGSAVQFDVGWDGVVNLVPGEAYTSNGSEMSTPFSGDRRYYPPTAPTNVNGAASSLEAFVLRDDKGGGYTYYKLRDLGAALGFQVGWSAERGVYVETDKPYQE